MCHEKKRRGLNWSALSYSLKDLLLVATILILAVSCTYLQFRPTELDYLDTYCKERGLEYNFSARSVEDPQDGIKLIVSDPQTGSSWQYDTYSMRNLFENWHLQQPGWFDAVKRSREKRERNSKKVRRIPDQSAE